MIWVQSDTMCIMIDTFQYSMYNDTSNLLKAGYKICQLSRPEHDSKFILISYLRNHIST